MIGVSKGVSFVTHTTQRRNAQLKLKTTCQIRGFRYICSWLVLVIFHPKTAQNENLTIVWNLHIMKWKWTIYFIKYHNFASLINWAVCFLGWQKLRLTVKPLDIICFTSSFRSHSFDSISAIIIFNSCFKHRSNITLNLSFTEFIA